MSETPEWFQRALDAPCESRTIEVHDCPIHYLRWGEQQKPGIVLVHGGAAHARWWLPIGPALTSEYAVAAIDLSGHGDSGRRERYSAELWGDEIMAVARRRRLRRASRSSSRTAWAASSASGHGSALRRRTRRER